MAKIRPFRGLRYDLSKAGEPASLLAPPYDVVDAEGRAEIGARSPHNCIHVILPEGEGDAKYDRGAAEFRRLIDEAFVRDDEPSFYVYHQTFTAEGQTYVRKGFVGLVELTRFGEGPVLPHERTLSGPKEDRLKLMRACDAHLELVFGMFSDPEKAWEKATADLGAPVLEAKLEDVEHRLYRVSDPTACEALAAVLADKSIYIADGHHRYETMCTFRDELLDAGRPDEVARWGMIYLSNLDDEGLVVLPTHRIVHGLEAVDLPGLVEDLGTHFDVHTEALPETPEALRATLIKAGAERAAFALSLPGASEMTVLVAKEDFDPAAAGLGELPGALQRLDVVLLHELVLERGLGITKEAQAAKTNLRYFKSTPGALDVAREGDGKAQLVCFMNATPVADVVSVCDSGHVMPQKSTFFFPKIPTGLTFRNLGDEG